MHAHTPNLGFLMRYAQDKNILKTRSKVKITVTRKMVCETPPSQDASTHQIWDSYLKEYRKYALDTKRDRQTNKVSKVAKIRNRYNQVPHLTQDTNGKVTNSQKTPQTRAKRSALSQQVKLPCNYYMPHQVP